MVRYYGCDVRRSNVAFCGLRSIVEANRLSLRVGWEERGWGKAIFTENYLDAKC
jgi:hypothetical protein